MASANPGPELFAAGAKGLCSATGLDGARMTGRNLCFNGEKPWKLGQ